MEPYAACSMRTRGARSGDARAGDDGELAVRRAHGVEELAVAARRAHAPLAFASHDLELDQVVHLSAPVVAHEAEVLPSRVCRPPTR